MMMIQKSLACIPNVSALMRLAEAFERNSVAICEWSENAREVLIVRSPESVVDYWIAPDELRFLRS